MSTSPSLNLTDSAAAKIAELIIEEGNPELKLQISIAGGGCSGFQYGFAFVETVDEEQDFIIQKEVTHIARNAQGEENNKTTLVQVVIDSITYQYLAGAKIDYQSGLDERFVISNPQAKTTCGCGSSFSVDDA